MSSRLRVIDEPKEVGYWDRAELPVGSMWRVPSRDEPDRECWCIVLPNMAGLWHTTERDPEGRQWSVSGEPPHLTVTPSINAEVHFMDGRVGGWHGFITNGEMTP